MINGSTHKINSLLFVTLFTVFLLIADGFATQAVSEVDNEELVNYGFNMGFPF